MVKNLFSLTCTNASAGKSHDVYASKPESRPLHISRAAQPARRGSSHLYSLLRRGTERLNCCRSGHIGPTNVTLWSSYEPSIDNQDLEALWKWVHIVRSSQRGGREFSGPPTPRPKLHRVEPPRLSLDKRERQKPTKVDDLLSTFDEEREKQHKKKIGEGNRENRPSLSSMLTSFFGKRRSESRDISVKGAKQQERRNGPPRMETHPEDESEVTQLSTKDLKPSWKFRNLVKKERGNEEEEMSGVVYAKNWPTISGTALISSATGTKNRKNSSIGTLTKAYAKLRKKKKRNKLLALDIIENEEYHHGQGGDMEALISSNCKFKRSNLAHTSGRNQGGEALGGGGQRDGKKPMSGSTMEGREGGGLSSGGGSSGRKNEKEEEEGKAKDGNRSDALIDVAREVFGGEMMVSHIRASEVPPGAIPAAMKPQHTHPEQLHKYDVAGGGDSFIDVAGKSISYPYLYVNNRKKRRENENEWRHKWCRASNRINKRLPKLLDRVEQERRETYALKVQNVFRDIDVGRTPRITKVISITAEQEKTSKEGNNTTAKLPRTTVMTGSSYLRSLRKKAEIARQQGPEKVYQDQVTQYKRIVEKVVVSGLVLKKTGHHKPLSAGDKDNSRQFSVGEIFISASVGACLNNHQIITDHFWFEILNRIEKKDFEDEALWDLIHEFQEALGIDAEKIEAYAELRALPKPNSVTNPQGGFTAKNGDHEEENHPAHPAHHHHHDHIRMLTLDLFDVFPHYGRFDINDYREPPKNEGGGRKEKKEEEKVYGQENENVDEWLPSTVPEEESEDGKKHLRLPRPPRPLAYRSPQTRQLLAPLNEDSFFSGHIESFASDSCCIYEGDESGEESEEEDEENEKCVMESGSPPKPGMKERIRQHVEAYEWKKKIPTKRTRRR